ncbi:hypothetical protein NZ698_13605 [Chryseobacterium sp. PBS4-4]|uniref:DUF481 domain-containing protein n=1 Tax=Chryseobacterium edaphi TaxID=2976532 RepID=A0ABT2W8B8_9FLAO|nr:hypothetical protein [Chryseobacterium edaphi]MCU7618240.1 hypothetical protein [Chryseobacterium edaphi]
MKGLYLLITVFFIQVLYSQTLIHHTTNYFGPNANPVPEFTDALIPENTTLTVTGDYYFGHGDQTLSNNLKVEIPLIPEKVSVKIWKTLVEHYSVTDEIVSRRAMQKNSGFATGDFYIQTRIKILSEKRSRPALVLNSTLKTASGSDFRNRRFFNTAGYYFDFELGKSFLFDNSFIEEVRLVSDVGFFSWDVQTPNLNVQDDAIMYGFKLILKHKNLSLENTFSGYNGWIKRVEDYGDRPMIFSSRLNFSVRKTLWFAQFQHGIKYFPYEQIRLGVQIPLEKLTPDFFGEN